MKRERCYKLSFMALSVIFCPVDMRPLGHRASGFIASYTRRLDNRILQVGQNVVSWEDQPLPFPENLTIICILVYI